ncbi:MAG: hypothetical protein FWD31_00480 [Planctomycetaceae bacterium]|nr:hypothetical protein [Planctomycetaceae bacterium]
MPNLDHRGSFLHWSIEPDKITLYDDVVVCFDFQVSCARFQFKFPGGDGEFVGQVDGGVTFADADRRTIGTLRR